MTFQVTMLWLANLVFDTTGHLAFKAASARADHLDGAAHWRALLTGPLLWLGLAAFVVEFFLWMALLTLAPLGMVVLIGCINIVSVMVGGRLVFGERITVPRAAAASLIGIGVMLVGWGGAV
jgi:drug/metabolite transporter (DMT)-like permease